MKRDWRVVAIIWVILTAVAEFLIFTQSYLPAEYAREARIVDDAFVLLMAFGAPVLTLVVTMLGYSAFRFRTTGEPVEDGPPQKGDKRIIGWWLGVTALLALIILINPGFVGLAEVRGDTAADLQIDVVAQRFTWQFTYPNGAVETDELVLPVGQRIRFDVTAKDVLHSFWIPAFRTKIDAVPGRTTEVYVTPEATGSFDDDTVVRVQCAELCGPGHPGMRVPVRIVEQAEFEQWVEALAQEEE